jgi:hypothetical protein
MFWFIFELKFKEYLFDPSLVCSICHNFKKLTRGSKSMRTYLNSEKVFKRGLQVTINCKLCYISKKCYKV